MCLPVCDSTLTLSSMCNKITHTGGIMHISEIRKLSHFEELEYLRLKNILKNYSQPRNKIQQLLKSGDLIRVKKGLYIFGEKAALGPYCKEHLANLIYGPSAISLEYALSFYNMIPESVVEITSITLRKNKQFDTPVGRFSYRYLTAKKYAYGITQIDIEGRNVLIAIPEKALCDMLIMKAPRLDSIDEMQEYLDNNLRLERRHLEKMNLRSLTAIASCYQHPNIDLLVGFVKEKYHA